MANPNINNDDDAMMEIIAGNNQCVGSEDDVNDRSQYIAGYEDIVHDNADEQENIMQDNACKVYWIINHIYCIHS
jgi:hypothetical protein